MNRHGSLRAGTASALVAILALGCATVEVASPTPGATDAPTHTVPTPVPTQTSTPSPSPSPAPPSPTPAPTGTPEAALTAEEIIASLVEFSTTDVPFILLAGGTFEGVAGGEQFSAGLEFDGATQGDKFSGTIAILQPGLTISVDAIIIGDLAWARPTGGDWEATTFDQNSPINVLDGLMAEDATYVGVSYASGRPLHTVTVNRWTGADPRTLGLKRPKVTIDRYEVTVNNDGNPELVELAYRLEGRLVGAPFDVYYDITYEMSDFGEPVTIEPPI